MTGAIVSGAERIEAEAFDHRVRRGVAALRRLGVGEGDVVALMLRNEAAYLEIMAAVFRLGAVFCPFNWHAAPPELAHLLDDASPKVFILGADLLPAARDVLPEGLTVLSVATAPEVLDAYRLPPPPRTGLPDWAALRDAEEPDQAPRARMRAMLRYTSGSTGRPKGILRKPRSPGADYLEPLRKLGAEMMRMRSGGRFFTAAPMYHSAPGTLSSMAMAVGDMDIHLAPRFEPESFLATISRERITHCYLVPTMMARLLKLPREVRESYDVSSLEFCVSTGSPWPHEIKMAMMEWWGPVMYESYGATELGFLTLATPRDAMERPRTAGRIQAGGSILILGPDKQKLPPGEVGEIHVRFDAFGDFDYTNEPETRARAEAHGHVSVGDLGWLDEDGYLFVSDRSKDMIISGGANIFPAEIEAVLIEAPFVQDCAVFGAPDPEFGERIVAAIQPMPGATPTEEDVRAWLDGRLARMKWPRVIDFHDQLPREDTGKVFKPRLRAPYWEKEGRRI